MATGRKLKEMLTAKNMSAAELSRKTGIPATTIRSIITKDTTPKIDTVYKIAAALECSVRDLIDAKTKDDHLIFDTPEEFDAYHDSILDDIYINKLRVPALKLNESGRETLLTTAEAMAANEDMTK